MGHPVELNVEINIVRMSGQYYNISSEYLMEPVSSLGQMLTMDQSKVNTRFLLVETVLY